MALTKVTPDMVTPKQSRIVWLANAVSFATFTNDDSWRDLDLSTAIPAGAKAAILRVVGSANAADKSFSVRNNGGADTIGGIQTQVTGVTAVAQCICPCDANRVIEYYGQAATWSGQAVRVLGYIL